MKKRHWIIIILAAAAMLRLWGLAEKSLWVDELHSISVSREFDNILPYCSEGHTPPLRYYMIHFLMQAKPVEAFVRLPSALSGIAATLAVYLLTLLLFGNTAAIVAGLIFAFSPWQIVHAQDARMYAVFFMLSAFSVLLVFRGMEKDRKAEWIGAGVIMAINAYITYFALWVNFIIFVFLCCLVLFRILKVKNISPPLSAKKLLINMAICYGAAAVVYSPWLLNLGHLMEKYNFTFLDTGIVTAAFAQENSPEETEQNLTTEPPVPGSAAPRVGHNPFLTKYNVAYFTGFLKKMGSENIIASFALLLFFILGLIVSFFQRRDFLLLCILWIVIPVIMVSTNRSLSFYFPHRYLFFYHLVFIIPAALGIVKSGEWISRKIPAFSRYLKERFSFNRSSEIIIALITAAFIVFFMIENIRYFSRENQNWRGAMAFLDEKVRDGDVIVTGHCWTEHGVKYYHDKESGKVTRLISDCLLVEDFREAVRSYSSLWYINWGPLPGPVQPIVDNNLELIKTFPGMKGDIHIYKKTGGE